MWAVVPLKNPADAKQRLSALLDVNERAALFLSMAEDVLEALAATRGLAGILVIAGSSDAAAIARRYRARIVDEAQGRGQTVAVSNAAALLMAETAEGLIQVPGDVPLVTPDEMGAVLAAHGRPPAMTIVPAHDRRGSNCVACSPPELIPFRFGNDSFEPHLAEARAAGVEPTIVELPGLGLDIDTPEDLAALAAQPGDTRAQRFLAERGILERLSAAPAAG